MSSLSRRGFIKSGATLAAVGATGVLGAANGFASDSGSGSPIRLGLASYSLRKFDRTKVIEDLKLLQTPFLNAKDMHLPLGTPEEVRAVAAEYAAAGVKLTAVGTIYFKDGNEADVRSKFEYCKAAGIPTMVAAPTMVALPAVEKFAREYGINVAIHNHGPEDKVFPSPFDVLKAVSGMDPRMGLCIDVGHAARAGADVPDAIEKAGARIYDIHMKDLADFHAIESQVDVGDGKMPVRAIFEALNAVHYKGYVDLEYEIHDSDPMPGMLKSFAYMRGVIDGMGYTRGA